MQKVRSKSVGCRNTVWNDEEKLSAVMYFQQYWCDQKKSVMIMTEYLQDMGGLLMELAFQNCLGEQKLGTVSFVLF